MENIINYFVYNLLMKHITMVLLLCQTNNPVLFCEMADPCLSSMDLWKVYDID